MSACIMPIVLLLTVSSVQCIFWRKTPVSLLRQKCLFDW